MAGINGTELIVLVVIAVIVLGPEKLPEYTRAFTQWLRRMRDMAEGAKTQFKEETGTDFDEVNWRKYDPRQYDPRRIIREALTEPTGSSTPVHRAQELTGVAPEDLHGGLTREDIADMDPRSLFRRPTGSGSSAAGPDDVAEAGGAVPSTPVSAETGSSTPAPAAGAAVVGGAAAALMGAGRAEATMALDRPVAPRPSAAPDPLELLGLAPAPFDVDAT